MSGGPDPQSQSTPGPPAGGGACGGDSAARSGEHGSFELAVRASLEEQISDGQPDRARFSAALKVLWSKKSGAAPALAGLLAGILVPVAVDGHSDVCPVENSPDVDVHSHP